MKFEFYKNYLDDFSLKNSPKENFIPGEIIVKFNSEVTKSS
jgi:hypothetical protein